MHKRWCFICFDKNVIVMSYLTLHNGKIKIIILTYIYQHVSFNYLMITRFLSHSCCKCFQITTILIHSILTLFHMMILFISLCKYHVFHIQPNICPMEIHILPEPSLSAQVNLPRADINGKGMIHISQTEIRGEVKYIFIPHVIFHHLEDSMYLLYLQESGGKIYISLCLHLQMSIYFLYLPCNITMILTMLS